MRENETKLARFYRHTERMGNLFEECDPHKDFIYGHSETPEARSEYVSWGSVFREDMEKTVRNALYDFFNQIAHEWVQSRFVRLAAEWRKETFVLSRVSAKTTHMSYYKIIGMGPLAVPFILKDLEANGPDHWFLALHAITEENPAKGGAPGDISAMTEAWLQWGKQKGYLTSSQTSTRIISRTLESIE